MPNLVGIWDPTFSEQFIRDTVAKQLQRVRISNISDTDYVYIRPGFGMALMDHGILENGKQPIQSKDGRFSLLLDGELYNADELKLRFRRDLPADVFSTPELCLCLILCQAKRVVRQFNGLFALPCIIGTPLTGSRNFGPFGQPFH